MRLGELLVRAKVLSVEELEQALRAQSVLGGRLGANLVRLELIDEDTLSKALARCLRTAAARPKELETIPHEVLSRITASVAEEKLIIPFLEEPWKKGKSKIVFAAVHPSIPLSDELRFLLGCEVELRVTPESTLRRALHRHYGVQANRDGRRDERSFAASVMAIPLDETELVLYPPQPQHDPTLARAPAQAARPNTVPKIVSGVPLSPPSRHKSDPKGAPTPPPSSMEVAFEAAERVADADGLETRLAKEEGRSLNDRDRIIEELTTVVAQSADLAACFVAREPVAFGWCARGSALPREAIEAITIPLKCDSILSTAYQQQRLVVSGRAGFEIDRRICKALGVAEPSGIAASVVSLKDRVVCIVLCVSRGTMAPEAEASIDAAVHRAAEQFLDLIRGPREPSARRI